jgi:FAD/FMN-containing dehydrogenase
VLKLAPKPAEKATAFVTLADLDAALALFGVAQETAGASLTAFEFMPRLALEFVLRNVPATRDPFPAPHPWYALLETSALKADGTAERLLTEALEAATERGFVGEAILARSLTQARDLWRLRESISEAQKPEGGNIKHDVSVPVARIPAFVARASGIVEALCPGARPLAMGHLGDGNVHYNIAQPVGMDKEIFLARWPEIARAVYDTVVDMGGSISAEHGIGQLRRTELAHVKSAVEMDLMRRIKAALDPKGILNPGKLL